MMKKYIKYPILFLAAAGLFAVSCNKEVGPGHLPNVPDLVRSPVPKFTPNPDLDAVIIEPSEFHAEFELDYYFPDDVPAGTTTDIDVAMSKDYDNIRKLKTGMSSLPETIDITGDDLADLFDVDIDDIVPGDQFELRTSFTLPDGTVLPGFADGISSIGSSPDLNSFPDAQTSITYRAVCPLDDINVFVGEMIVDDPDFFEGSYTVDVTSPEPNVLKVSGLNFGTADDVEIHLDPKTLEAEFPHQVVTPGDVSDIVGPYHNFAMEGGGVVDVCDLTITLDIEWTVDEGSFGNETIVLKKE